MELSSVIYVKVDYGRVGRPAHLFLVFQLAYAGINTQKSDVCMREAC